MRQKKTWLSITENNDDSLLKYFDEGIKNYAVHLDW